MKDLEGSETLVREANELGGFPFDSGLAFELLGACLDFLNS